MRRPYLIIGVIMLSTYDASIVNKNQSNSLERRGRIPILLLHCAWIKLW